jgi:hypothetical protein
VVRQNIIVGSIWWSRVAYLSARKQRERERERESKQGASDTKAHPGDLPPPTRSHLLEVHSAMNSSVDDFILLLAFWSFNTVYVLMCVPK